MAIRTFSNSAGSEKSCHTDCPVCGGRDPRFLWDIEGALFHQCRSCSHLYQYPVPLQDELVDRYSDEYLAYEIENEDAFFNLMQMALDDIFFWAEAEKRRLRGGRILDIGCATGRLVYHFLEAGWKAEGIEICIPAAEYGIKKRGIPITTRTLEETRFPDNHFQVIHASHLIEHLADPASFLLEVNRVLSPGGLLILATPNRAGAQARILGSRWRSVIPDHIHLFSKRNLLKLLKKSGMIPVRSGTWGGLAKGLGPSWIKKPVDRLAKTFGFGDVMVVLSEKPQHR
jgi:2-polyprenyl-3-methyl-5-hydroxy-6-metoxy-1,4-benzoquinol methylase